MRRTSKAQSLGSPAARPQLVDGAKEYVFNWKPPSQFPCRVCGTSGATDRSDRLCWVCWRLKTSAWRSAEASDSSGN